MRLMIPTIGRICILVLAISIMSCLVTANKSTGQQDAFIEPLFVSRLQPRTVPTVPSSSSVPVPLSSPSLSSVPSAQKPNLQVLNAAKGRMHSQPRRERKMKKSKGTRKSSRKKRIISPSERGRQDHKDIFRHSGKGKGRSSHSHKTSGVTDPFSNMVTPQLNTDNMIDLMVKLCRLHQETLDDNVDRRISQNEFANFVQSFCCLDCYHYEEYLPFSSLPMDVQLLFVHNACDRHAEGIPTCLEELNKSGREFYYQDEPYELCPSLVPLLFSTGMVADGTYQLLVQQYPIIQNVTPSSTKNVGRVAAPIPFPTPSPTVPQRGSKPIFELGQAHNLLPTSPTPGKSSVAMDPTHNDHHHHQSMGRNTQDPYVQVEDWTMPGGASTTTTTTTTTKTTTTKTIPPHKYENGNEAILIDHSSTPSQGNNGGTNISLSNGAIVGIISGIFCAVVAVAIFLYIYKTRKDV